ncbi:hypothetical protein FISHEDRAFT_60855 [Fistulina hepatica ATCC 64428]|uniref:BZIP domain-containing protein n=1 Tax=Fistulina hepatica ATCC 64428 TaxID=1128425 RepID=A0A0D7A5P4_9AGAR|nr:hypothetical protein FISHEDRAFT_60855 [Fistulina hepatica ATCC 64428]
MASFSEPTPFWDLSQASAFSTLPDDDFLALLQKQFPSTVATSGTPPIQSGNSDGPFNLAGVDPQSLYRIPTLSSSEDSSPSPPSTTSNSKDSPENDDGGEPALKRKASGEDVQEGPSHKAQHTSSKKDRPASAAASSPTHLRRKSTGATAQKDESRLLKRKEQNRAAQRAFRERKEKHVKDLEEKVAQLEAKNSEATTVNENLKEMLSRLQSENLLLKQASQANFTFSMPKNAASVGSLSDTTRTTPILSTDASLFALPRSGSASTSPQLDWGNLTSFDSNMMKVLDDGPQPTATSGGMQMSFGFGGEAKDSPADSSRSVPMFDMNGSLAWPQSAESPSLDELFGGYIGQGPVDFSALFGNAVSSISPVVHNTVPSTFASTSGSTSSTSSPDSDPSILKTPKDTEPLETAQSSGCPRTKAEMARHIGESGSSSFACEPKTVAIHRGSDGESGEMIMCKGSSFPRTQKSDKNVEVLKAWRTITSDPKYKKDTDINELCAEFTSKARCDGTKVVLEPSGVSHIIESLSKRRHA